MRAVDGEDAERAESARRRAKRESGGTPRAWALRMEGVALPPGEGERFAGYGVLSLPFESGDLLAFRRFPASSLGPGYNAVWHRDRAGCWTFYTTVDARLACPRYFGARIERTVQVDIEATWVGHDHLVVSVPARRIEWSMRLAPSAATRTLNLVAALMPARAWRSPRWMALVGGAAGVLLGAGPLRLTGRVPNGQRYALRLRRLWRIAASAALVEGRELGPIGAGGGAELGDFRLPGTGLFACGTGVFEPFESGRHLSSVTRTPVAGHPRIL